MTLPDGREESVVTSNMHVIAREASIYTGKHTLPFLCLFFCLIYCFFV